jgi:opacity protein-like surface antigen
LDDSEGLGALTAGARITRNIVVVAEYFKIGRDATKAIDRSLVIQDVTYPVNAQLTTGFDSDVYRLTVGYSFYHKDNVEIGAAIGLHATDFSVAVTGTGSVNGGPPVGGTVRRQEILAPNPTVGLYGSAVVAKNLTFSARLDYLSLNVGDYDGSLTNAQAGFAYQIMDNIAIGAMYRYVNYKVDVEKTDYNGRLKYRFSGPALFLRARM